ncbi:MAG: GNAT family N-acetyltransferase [Lachnospiraceae bacterium]|nr:GNAT family N-acetyltransferase [Lachnospiraceae bacterium]
MREGSVRRLTGEEKKKCRELWEEIFTEDSEEFLDYYDRWKYTKNECYGIFDGDKLVSMVQLNPYDMQFQPEGANRSRRLSSRYLVAVATKEEYRHRGMMKRLLKESLGAMREKGMPFVFLMPAAEAIYYPLGFRYFYESSTGTLDLPKKAGETALVIRQVKSSDLSEIVAFSEEVQGELFGCYTRRDRHYYEMLLAELKSEGGALLLLETSATDGQTEADERAYSKKGEADGEAYPKKSEIDEEADSKRPGKKGRIVALVPYWGENPVEIREILCRPDDRESVLLTLSILFYGGQKTEREDFQKTETDRISISGASFALEGKKPVIMGRIVDALSFLELFSADSPMEMILELSDGFLEENSGLYRWSLSQEGSRALRQDEMLQASELMGGKKGRDISAPEIVRVRYTVEELFACLMGAGGPDGPLRSVRGCRNFYINEIV